MIDLVPAAVRRRYPLPMSSTVHTPCAYRQQQKAKKTSRVRLPPYAAQVSTRYWTHLKTRKNRQEKDPIDHCGKSALQVIA
ncbi:hypothetical protein RRG08_040699 [Elysia crispata]|uniref:Uncharacterized protein n=1 Tax=Elysia crispata TaxID=231223 RepID=A0AAE1AY97_9GAST|nr:hypothetical protein RRG08_040699 [Elysia crispata]